MPAAWGACWQLHPAACQAAPVMLRLAASDGAIMLPRRPLPHPPADETELRGRPEVYASVGFNRWTHQGECESSMCVCTCAPGRGAARCCWRAAGSHGLRQLPRRAFPEQPPPPPLLHPAPNHQSRRASCPWRASSRAALAGTRPRCRCGRAACCCVLPGWCRLLPAAGCRLQIAGTRRAPGWGHPPSHDDACVLACPLTCLLCNLRPPRCPLMPTCWTWRSWTAATST